MKPCAPLTIATHVPVSTNLPMPFRGVRCGRWHLPQTGTSGSRSTTRTAPRAPFEPFRPEARYGHGVTVPVLPIVIIWLRPQSPLECIVRTCGRSSAVAPASTPSRAPSRSADASRGWLDSDCYATGVGGASTGTGPQFHAPDGSGRHPSGQGESQRHDGRPASPSEPI